MENFVLKFNDVILVLLGFCWFVSVIDGQVESFLTDLTYSQQLLLCPSLVSVDFEGLSVTVLSVLFFGYYQGFDG